MDEIPEKYRTDLAIIRETAEQINKDIGASGFEVTLSGNAMSAFNELKEQLSPFVGKWLKGDRQVFQSLLYRIDIPEKDFKAMLRADAPDLAGKISELIIRREFQKVLTRRFFSGKK
jgi:hypothetical protein